MKQPTKPQLLRIAAGMCGLAMNDAGADLILELIKGIETKKGEFSLRDAAKIEARIQKKYKPEVK